MNVFLFELRQQLRQILLQTVVLSGLLMLFILGMYPIYLSAQDQVQTMLSGFPPQFATMFGMDVTNIFSYGGFYSFGNLYLVLVGAIMAASLGFAVFAREKRSRCADFLLTKPLGRTRTFCAKLLACIVGLLVVNLVFVAVSIALYEGTGEDSLAVSTVALVALGMAGTQLVFLSLSVLLSVFMRRVRSASGPATMLGFMGFVMTALVNLTGEQTLRYFSPSQYFDPSTVFSGSSYDGGYVMCALVVIVACLAISFVRYRAFDVPTR